jgi:hypothetical protein
LQVSIVSTKVLVISCSVSNVRDKGCRIVIAPTSAFGVFVKPI